MRMRWLALASLGLLSASAPALAAAAPISVSDAQVRASLGGSTTSAAYMTLTNHTDRPDRLVGVDCACAAKAEAHITRTQNGVTSMAPAGPVTVPAHGRVRFSPDGLHIMLTGVKGDLKAGRIQPMTLHFEHAGTLTVPFAVKSQITGGMGGMQGMSGMGGMADMPGMSH